MVLYLIFSLGIFIYWEEFVSVVVCVNVFMGGIFLLVFYFLNFCGKEVINFF